MEELSLFSTDSAVNESINVEYTPDSSVYYFTYQIHKDDEIIFESDILKKDTNILLEESGNYKITFNEYNRRRVVTVKTSGEYIIDKESPVINSNSVITLIPNDEYKLNDLGITAYDNVDGVISHDLDCNIKDIDFNEIGNKELICSVEDQAGNKTTTSMLINIEREHINVLLTLQITSLFILVGIIIYMFKYERSLKLENRIDRYSLKAIKDTSLSTFDKIFNKYINLNNKLVRGLRNFKTFEKRAKRYFKYETILPMFNSYNLLVNKLFSSISLVIVISLIKSLRLQLLTGYEFIIVLIIGYFIPNIIYSVLKEKEKTKQENDFLEAVIIMNNSFKAGKSIIQAVKTVVDELGSDLAQVFEVVYQQLNMGNDTEDAFSYLANKLDMEEAYYLSSSITVLNKTGGDVSKVFTNIEKNLKDKRVIKLELKTITASAKLMSDILIILPIVFVTIVTAINHDYFKPLFTNFIGIVLLIIMISLYILYIIIIKKIIRVKE